MADNLIGQNLLLLRDSKGLTQRDLAQAAELSLAGYKKIESGQTSAPQYRTLKSLARALEVKTEAFFQPIPQLKAVRFRSSDQLKNRSQILIRVGRWLERYNQLEELLEERDTYSLSASNPRPRGKNQRYLWAQEQAAHIREQVGIDPRFPIRDICGLLESQGIKLYNFSLANHGFFGLSVNEDEGGPMIAINTWRRISVERWIFTAAHELAHLILHPADYQIEERDEPEAHEHEANIFASHFLAPREVFLEEWQQSDGIPFVDRVLKLKHMFRVSYKTIIWRLVEEGLMDEDAWLRFQADYAHRYKKTLGNDDEPEALSARAFLASFPEAHSGQEPFGLSKLEFMSSRLHSLVKRALNEGMITWLHAADVLGLSLDEFRRLAIEWHT